MLLLLELLLLLPPLLLELLLLLRCPCFYYGYRGGKSFRSSSSRSSSSSSIWIRPGVNIFIVLGPINLGAHYEFPREKEDPEWEEASLNVRRRVLCIILFLLLARPLKHKTTALIKQNSATKSHHNVKENDCVSNATS